MFVGRHQELEQLNQAYQENDFQFTVIYGRRRIGKTSLINEFLKDKKAIYYVALEENAEDNLKRFSDAISIFKNTDQGGKEKFANFEECFKEITRLAQKQRVILVIDEFPYLAKAYPTISSMLQSYIDHEFKETNLFLILCGSSMSFMERQVLGYQSPLYGRRTLALKLEPFKLSEAHEMLPKLSKEDAFIINTVCGGVPQYLSYMSDSMSVADNIKKNFLSKSGRLFDEPNNLLQQELRDPTNYNSIINAIASGASKHSKIAQSAHLQTGPLTTYLNNLIDLGIVEKKLPVTEQKKSKSKNIVYRICDGMFRFWYTFVGKQTDLIERGLTDLAWVKVQKGLSDFMGPEFEKYSQDFMWSQDMNEKIVPNPFIHLGNWWGTDKRTHQQVELDIIGFSDDERDGYFGECKWKNEPISRSVLEKLITNSEIFKYPIKHYYLFSKSGFTDSCQELAEKINCQLFTFEKM
ncbi:ATP-binding protein [Lactobacillus crispatus]|uniref:ATP-binding protein n=1 Tax=Lactobacillus crispatus TaxID=47770 RepID=A0A2N5L0J6_9LACO|nr:ATP-binding protein [Lactobacillus crispatus]MDK6664562.1 ATP-binding protein [Lactobacillus crispatus]MDK7319778.1 ATP-binding protein [Lactobacillus crispatus]MDK8272245.1 ATP-binding protein [Lactobacillus crispatus]MDK8568313.1 ATP-binding protein [Lactobacillus crispatus]MDK8612016.1 ATP-binding protein [Lactobacillus crispatus]